MMSITKLIFIYLITITTSNLTNSQQNLISSTIKNFLSQNEKYNTNEKIKKTISEMKMKKIFFEKKEKNFFCKFQFENEENFVICLFDFEIEENFENIENNETLHAQVNTCVFSVEGFVGGDSSEEEQERIVI